MYLLDSLVYSLPHLNNIPMIRRLLADGILNYLAFFPFPKGKYRVAQVAALLLDGVPIKSRYGPMLCARFADSTFWLAARYGNDEVVNLMEDLSSSDFFIDVGANIGLTTLLACERCAGVISLEASPREFEQLLKNCHRLSRPPFPVLLRAAASDRSGFSTFRINHLSHSGGNSFGAARSADEAETIVPMIRLDSLLDQQARHDWPELGIACNDGNLVVKIDVEGFERNVLKGLTHLLREGTVRKVIVEVNTERLCRYQQDFFIDDFMAGFGYTPIVAMEGKAHFDQCYVRQCDGDLGAK